MGWLTGIEPATPGATILSQIKETQQPEGGFSELETAPETTVFSEWMAPFLGVEHARDQFPFLLEGSGDDGGHVMRPERRECWVRVKRVYWACRTKRHRHDTEDEALDCMRRYEYGEVELLPLTVRSWNCLRAAGITSLDALISHSAEELLRLPNLGRASLRDIRDVLYQRGLALRGDDFPTLKGYQRGYQ